ncbi:unnamed protein product, partial [Rotaria magnacalcarata]
WVDHTIGNNNNKKNNLDDEQMSDIAVIYSLVRHASNRRTSSLTSSPKIIVSPISVNTNNINNANSNSISRSLINKNYTLE